MIDYMSPKVIKILLGMSPVDFSIGDDDFCHCQDDGCPKHETCRRWIGNYKGTGQYLSMTETLREGEKCGYYKGLAK